MKGSFYTGVNIYLLYIIVCIIDLRTPLALVLFVNDSMDRLTRAL